MSHQPWTDLLLCWAPPVPLQVLAVSSAGAVFEQMRDVAPFTLAAWRLQLTSVILMCGALWQWRGMVSGRKPACEPLEWLLTMHGATSRDVDHDARVGFVCGGIVAVERVGESTVVLLGLYRVQLVEFVLRP